MSVLLDTLTMLQLVYSSIARQPVAQVILSIVRSAEQHNERMGISGMLVYDRQAYLQLLEGTPRAVLQLYSLIADDSRHRICSQWKRKCEQRMLSASLCMGYKQAEFPSDYLFSLEDRSGPGAVDFAVQQAQLKYPKTCGLGPAASNRALSDVTPWMIGSAASRFRS